MYRMILHWSRLNVSNEASSHFIPVAELLGQLSPALRGITLHDVAASMSESNRHTGFVQVH